MPPRKKSIGKRSKSEKLSPKSDQGNLNHLSQSNEIESPETDIINEVANFQKRKEIKEKEFNELLSFFLDYSDKFWHKRAALWENECWNRYIYMSRELNPLSLPDVNAYLTEWDEDNVYTVEHIFDQCRKSQKICEEIKMALLKCPNVNAKTLKSWMESANEYVNDESFNMEFSAIDNTDRENEPADITLCLWGNLSKNVRHKGLDVPSLGFSFELPPELLKINCAVRILHTSFDNITHIFCESSVPLHWKLGETPVQTTYTDEFLGEMFDKMDDALLKERLAQFEESLPMVLSDTVSVASKQLMLHDNAGKGDLEKNPSTMLFTPPDEPEITIVEKSEYFVVGGIYHFDLFHLPSPTVKAGCWIFTHCEKKVLIHIPYQTSIIPIRHPKPDMSPALAAEFADSEIKRFDREMCNALTISLKLPDNVLFLEQPIPAFWLEDKKGFTRVGFFETKLDEDTGRIFFKTNRFGIIGFLQRKYNNMPYQSWELIAGDKKNTAILGMVGMHVSLKIKIQSGKCCIHEIEQDGKLLFTDIYTTWMSPEFLVKKLLSMGINIIVDTDINKYVEIFPKESELENWTYSCMALLCHEYNFFWSKWNAIVQVNQLVMRYNVKDYSPEMHHVLITKDRASEVKSAETHSKFCDEPVDENLYCSNLYHLLMCRSEKPLANIDDFEFLIMVKKGATKECKVLPIHIACLTGNKAALKSIVISVSRRVLETRDSLGRTPLIITVTRNYVDCGSVLLKAGVTVDNTDNAGQTALHIAACQGFYHFVKLLLSHKASWMQRDYFGATALHMAAINPNVKGLSTIIKYVKRAEIDIQDSTLKTALHWSAAYAYNDNIKLLLSQGANACIPDEDGKTPLHLAVANSDPEALDCVRTLLKKELSLINWQDYQGRSPLHVAVACGSEEVLYLLASREDCNVDLLDNSFCTPLHCAAKRGFFEKADILLKKRASHLSIDEANGATPLHYAAHNNHAETVQVFTSKNYINDEPDKFGRNALMWAAIKNADAALKVLADNVVNISSSDRNGFNALHAAAIHGNVNAIELLVKSGLPVDLKDKYGMTPFLKACEFGRTKAAQSLLNLGANIDETDFNLCSALHWSARGGHAYLTQILIKYGIDYNIRDSFRMAPLHYASSTGDFINCTCVLVESGANPNIVDIEGKTPLHYAVLNERPGIIKYLCEHDSDVNAMFLLEDWVTPLDCAVLKENAEIVQLLKKYGGIYAQDIKEYAAVVIQNWFRKRRSTVHKEYYKFEENSSNSSFYENTSYYFPSDEDCIPVSELLPSFQSSVKNTTIYHMCNGCFHKIDCKHVCKKKHSQNIIENKAASVIQRTWRRYSLKKQFARLRSEVASGYSSNDMRLADEELWKTKLKNFHESLKEYCS